MCMCMCLGQRTVMGIIPQVPSTLFVLRHLTEPRILPFSWILWLVVTWACLQIPCPGITSTCHDAHPFHMGSGEHAYMASTLPTQLSPQPHSPVLCFRVLLHHCCEVNLMDRRITILRKDRGDIIRGIFCLVRTCMADQAEAGEMKG